MSIQVGQGATYIIGSDCYPYTVVEVVSEKRVIVQADDFERADNNGQSESQSYEYKPNTDSIRIVVTLRKNGHWHRSGESIKSGCFSFKGRRAYQDPSF